MSKLKPAPLPAGTVIGGYQIVKKLAAGGFGVVYLAECDSTALAQWVASVAPSELIFSAEVSPVFEKTIQSLADSLHLPIQLRPAWQFDSALGARELLAHLQAASLQAWNAQDVAQAHAAANALIAYA